MSKESLIKSLSIDRDIEKGLDQSKLTKWAAICNALNKRSETGLFDDNHHQIKSNALDITFCHGNSLRAIANALNLCQRARD